MKSLINKNGQILDIGSELVIKIYGFYLINFNIQYIQRNQNQKLKDFAQVKLSNYTKTLDLGPRLLINIAWIKGLLIDQRLKIPVQNK